jgi:hypothetical protein
VALTRVEMQPMTGPVGLVQQGVVDGLWQIRLRLEERGSGQPPALVALTVEAPAGSAITAKGWQSIPVGEITDRAIELYREEQAEVDEVARGLHDAFLAEGKRRPGRLGHPDAFYAQLAFQYVHAVESGSRRPLALLADSFGWSRKVTDLRLQTARARGLLTSYPDRRPGGELTAKAYAALGIEQPKGQVDGKYP